jgi:hypothetical protein
MKGAMWATQDAYFFYGRELLGKFAAHYRLRRRVNLSDEWRLTGMSRTSSFRGSMTGTGVTNSGIVRSAEPWRRAWGALAQMCQVS